MRTISPLTLAALLLCSGCQQDSGKHAVQPDNQPQFSVDLPAAHVDILNRSDDMQNGKAVRMSLRVTYPDGAVRERILSLAASRDGSDAGYAATLLDANGALIVNATQRWGVSLDSTVRYFLSEATPVDHWDLRTATKGTRVHETYTLNGASFDADYDRSTASEQQARTAFVNFYHPSGIPKSPFAGNIDGSVMLQLITDRGFAEWLTGSSLPSITIQQAPKIQCISAGCICGGATVCSIIACTIGGALDPVCDVCGAVAVLCFIASFFA